MFSGIPRARTSSIRVRTVVAHLIVAGEVRYKLRLRKAYPNYYAAAGEFISALNVALARK